jgi:hypothetical protein
VVGWICVYWSTTPATADTDLDSIEMICWIGETWGKMEHCHDVDQLFTIEKNVKLHEI